MERKQIEVAISRLDDMIVRDSLNSTEYREQKAVLVKQLAAFDAPEPVKAPEAPKVPEVKKDAAAPKFTKVTEADQKKGLLGKFRRK